MGDNETKGKRSKPVFAPKEEWEMLSQGAEARVWKVPAGTKDFPIDCSKSAVIVKERFSKAYRHPILDERLTKSRCRAEGRLLEKCLQKGDGKIDVPKVFRVDPPLLYLEWIDGKTVRQHIEDNTQEEDSLAAGIGRLIAHLHNVGIIHGDLTTSNMLLRRCSSADTSSSPTLIDFGLSKSTQSAEERAVDLYVLERALSSTHPNLSSNFLEHLLETYGNEAEKSQATLQRLEQVRLRGRKRECFG